MATPRPAQASISASLRPSPTASTSVGLTSEIADHLVQTGRLGDPLGGDVQPGAVADVVLHTVQPELLGQGDEVAIRAVRVAQDDPGDRSRAELLDVLDHHLTGQVTRREVPAQPVAAADLLDRDQRAGGVRRRPSR